MPLMIQQNAKCNQKRHCHGKERPADPSRIVHCQESSFRDAVNWYWGKDRDSGYDGHGEREAQALRPPIQTVDIEDFRDPHQGRDVVEAVIDEEEEPEVDLDACFAVTWYFVSSQCAQGIKILIVWQIVCWEW